MKKDAVAYHEAGHAVMAVWSGIGIKKATIVPEGGAAGYIRKFDRPADRKIEFDNSLRARARIDVTGRFKLTHLGSLQNDPPWRQVV